MAIASTAWVNSEEVAARIGRLKEQYAGNPLVKRIEHRIGTDYDDDPAIFIDVVLASDDATAEQVVPLSQEMRIDLLSLVRAYEVGLHAYLSFKTPSQAGDPRPT